MTGSDLPTCSVPLAAGIATGEQWRQQHPTWLLTALREGSVTDRGRRGERTVRPVEVHVLGALPLPDGRLVACDPYLVEAGQRPFTVTLPAGDHPAVVGIVRIADDHVRPTALCVVTGTAPVVRWTLATTDDGPGDDLAPYEITGYGVDAGTGALFSPLALPALVAVRDEDEGMLEDPLSEAMEASPVDAVLLPPREGALAVAQCASGWGDGVYATWVGWDDAGGVSIVMTDFAVVNDPWTPVDDAAAAPTADPPPPGSGSGSGTGGRASDAPRRGFWSRLFGREG